MARRWSTPLLVAACAIALIGLPACADKPESGLPDTVTVEVMQGRTDYSSGTLVIRIINDSSEDLTVTAASLEAAGFTEPARWDRGTTVRSGTTVDLRAPVPEPDCASTAGDPRVTLTIATGASSTTVTVPASDPLKTLERLHATGCVADEVERIVAVTAGLPEIAGSGRSAVAILPVTLTPTGADGQIDVTSVASTPLLRPAPPVADSDPDDWPVAVTVDAASGPATVPLRIVPARCDPHAIAEDKVGTVFVLTVSTTSGATGSYRLVPAEDVRKALLDFVRSTCEMA